MEIRLETLPRDEIKLLPGYSPYSGELPEGLEDSVKALGFVYPIVVSEDGYLLDGYKRLTLDWVKEFPAIVVDGLTCGESAHDCMMVRLLLNNERKPMTKEEKTLLVAKIMLELDYTPEEADRLLRGEVPNSVVKKLQEKFSFELSPATVKRYIKSALDNPDLQKFLVSKATTKGEVKVKETPPSPSPPPINPPKVEPPTPPKPIEQEAEEQAVEPPVEVKVVETHTPEVSKEDIERAASKIRDKQLYDGLVKRCTEAECPRWFIDALASYPNPEPIVEVWLEKLPSLSYSKPDIPAFFMSALSDYDLTQAEELILAIALETIPRKPEQGLGDFARWLIRLGRTIQDLGIKTGLIEGTTVGQT